MGTLIVKPKNISPGYENFLHYSEALDNSYWSVNLIGSVTANDSMAPDGTVSASKVVFLANTSVFSVNSGVISQGAKYIFSGWFKAASINDEGQILAYRHVGRQLYSFITLTSSWQRVSSVEVAFSNLLFTGIYGSSLNSGDIISAHIWGLQLQSGDILTPYQKTNGTPNIH